MQKLKAGVGAGGPSGAAGGAAVALRGAPLGAAADPLSAFFQTFLARLRDDGDLSAQWQKVQAGASASDKPPRAPTSSIRGWPSCCASWLSSSALGTARPGTAMGAAAGAASKGLRFYMLVGRGIAAVFGGIEFSSKLAPLALAGLLGDIGLAQLGVFITQAVESPPPDVADDVALGLMVGVDVLVNAVIGAVQDG